MHSNFRDLLGTYLLKFSNFSEFVASNPDLNKIAWTSRVHSWKLSAIFFFSFPLLLNILIPMEAAQAYLSFLFCLIVWFGEMTLFFHV